MHNRTKPTESAMPQDQSDLYTVLNHIIIINNIKHEEYLTSKEKLKERLKEKFKENHQLINAIEINTAKYIQHTLLSPLTLAILLGEFDIVMFLAENGADIKKDFKLIIKTESEIKIDDEISSTISALAFPKLLDILNDKISSAHFIPAFSKLLTSKLPTSIIDKLADGLNSLTTSINMNCKERMKEFVHMSLNENINASVNVNRFIQRMNHDEFTIHPILLSILLKEEQIAEFLIKKTRNQNSDAEILLFLSIAAELKLEKIVLLIINTMPSEIYDLFLQKLLLDERLAIAQFIIKIYVENNGFVKYLPSPTETKHFLFFLLHIFDRLLLKNQEPDLSLLFLCFQKINELLNLENSKITINSVFHCRNYTKTAETHVTLLAYANIHCKSKTLIEMLIEGGADPMQAIPEQKTIAEENLTLLSKKSSQFLPLKNSSDLREEFPTDYIGYSALQLAVAYKRLDFLPSYTDFISKSSFKSLFFLALRLGQDKMIIKLLEIAETKKISIDFTDPISGENTQNITPLLLAINSGKIKTVKLIIRMLSNQNQNLKEHLNQVVYYTIKHNEADENGNFITVNEPVPTTPLLAAIHAPANQLAIFELLLAAGADPFLEVKDNLSLLQAAVWLQHFSIVKILIEKLQVKNYELPQELKRFGTSIIDFAGFSSLPIIKYLLKQGLVFSDVKTNPLFQEIIKKRNISFPENKFSIPILNILSAEKFDIDYISNIMNVLDNNTITNLIGPLELSMVIDNQAASQELVKKGINPRRLFDETSLALIELYHEKNIPIFEEKFRRLLQRFKAIITIDDFLRGMPLFTFACFQKNDAFARYLIKKIEKIEKAEGNLKNQNPSLSHLNFKIEEGPFTGWTPLATAIFAKNFDLAKLLITKGVELKDDLAWKFTFHPETSAPEDFISFFLKKTHEQAAKETTELVPSESIKEIPTIEAENESSALNLIEIYKLEDEIREITALRTVPKSKEMILYNSGIGPTLFSPNTSFKNIKASSYSPGKWLNFSAIIEKNTKKQETLLPKEIERVLDDLELNLELILNEKAKIKIKDANSYERFYHYSYFLSKLLELFNLSYNYYLNIANNPNVKQIEKLRLIARHVHYGLNFSELEEFTRAVINLFRKALQETQVNKPFINHFDTLPYFKWLDQSLIPTYLQNRTSLVCLQIIYVETSKLKYFLDQFDFEIPIMQHSTVIQAIKGLFSVISECLSDLFQNKKFSSDQYPNDMLVCFDKVKLLGDEIAHANQGKHSSDNMHVMTRIDPKRIIQVATELVSHLPFIAAKVKPTLTFSAKSKKEFSKADSPEIETSKPEASVTRTMFKRM